MRFLLPIYQIWFLVFFIANAALLSGQTYHPFPKQGSWYFQKYTDQGQPIPGYELFRTLGDTTIEGHQYMKLYLNSIYHGALRDSSKRIYYRAAAETRENILYDFNKMVGDTIITPYPMEPTGTSCDTFIIYEDTQILTLDGSRRVLKLGGCSGVDWIESIGNIWWLTSPGYIGSVSGGSYLSCFFDSTQLIYSIDNIACTIGVSVTKDQGSAISAYPNPTTGQFNVHISPQTPFCISIWDVRGKQKMRFQEGVSTADISSLPNGVYWVRVESKSGVRGLKMVKMPE